MSARKWFPDKEKTIRTSNYEYIIGIYSHAEYGDNCLRVTKYKLDGTYIGHFVLVDGDWYFGRNDKFTEMIKVICINAKGTTKLLEGKTYNAISLSELTDYTVRIRCCECKKRQLRIDGVNTYFVDRFIPRLGASPDDFYTMSLFDDYTEKRNLLRIERNDNLTGQYIRCRWHRNSKSLKEGEIYFVEEHKVWIDSSAPTWRQFQSYIKLKGIKRMIETRGFEKIPLAEQRKIKLQTLDGKEIKTGVDQRKFLLYSEKEKIDLLFEILSLGLKNLRGLNDLNNVTITEIMLKSGRKYDLLKEDIEPFLNKSVSSVLKQIGLKP